MILQAEAQPKRRRTTSEAIVNIVVAEANRFPFERSQLGDLEVHKNHAFW